MNKVDYKIQHFPIGSHLKTQDWINALAKNGYKIFKTHLFNNDNGQRLLVIMERNQDRN